MKYMMHFSKAVKNPVVFLEIFLRTILVLHVLIELPQKKEPNGHVCLGNAVSLSCGETGQAPENLEV
jgi:hypothetical protein